MRPVRLAAAVLGAGLLTLGRATPARGAADSVLVRVGGDLSARIYEYIDVPITVDLSGAPGRALGSYRAKLSFDSTKLALVYQGITNGNFAAPLVNYTHAADSGKVLVTAVQPPGATGVVTIFIARFHVKVDSVSTPISVSFDEMSATVTSVTPFESLLALLKIVNGTFCRSLGRWGDVNGDGLSNSFDALVALSSVVGDSMDTTVVKPYLADVDADGKVTSRDALIMLSYGVGLPVPGFRILLTAAGACGTGAAITLVVMPDSLELQAGQGVAVLVSARDATGRAVPVDSVAWTSSDPSIAAFEGTAGQIVGRAPGVATLTAQLGPGVAGRLKVSVLARRVNWYVDVERARMAPTQVGSQNLPMEFIGDALSLAHSGDTVRVASGIYEETIASYSGAAVAIIGDSVNRPVIDPRGSPYWYSYQWAIAIEPYQGLLSLANLVVRAGKVYLDAHDIAVRNVRIEGLGGTYGWAALEMYSENLTPALAPQAGGPIRSSMPTAPGNVLVDGVVVVADSTTNGIVVDLADTAVIQNSTVTRSHAGTYPYCGVGPSTPSGIRVYQASVSLVRNNTVANPQCQGIGVFDAGNAVVSDVGRVTISRNQVTGAPGVGIGAGARLVALDHNVVRNTGVAGYRTYGYTIGVHVVQVYSAGSYLNPDSVVSVGDSILNSGGRGFGIDSALAAVVDSLVVSGTGQDSSSYGGYGVDLQRGGRFSLSHSHLSSALFDNAVSVQGVNTVVRTHGNRISLAGYNGISAYGYCYGRPYVAGPDTLISVADTIVGSTASGIHSSCGLYTQVDSAVVDSAGRYNGIEVSYVGRLSVQNSSFRRAFYAGIRANTVDSVRLSKNRSVANLSNGIYLQYVTDTARVFGAVIDSSGSSGISVYYGVRLAVDSTAVTHSGRDGIHFDYLSGGRVTRSRLDGNHRYGLEITSYDTVPVIVRRSTIQNSDSGGAANFSATYTTINADSNYWGDPNGPRCRVGTVVGCSGLSVTGDSLTTSGVTFANWLTSPATPTPAPPSFVVAVSQQRALRTASEAATAGGPTQGYGSASQEPGAPQAPALSSAATTSAVVAPPPDHQRAPAWHAPSRARAHAVQGATKRQ